MLKKSLTSFMLAIHNIRSHFFHTLLSVLGIVIGVAALVSILSLIDGMEKYANEQIASTTSLNAIVVSTDVNKVVNNVKVRKDTIRYIGYDDFSKLTQSLSKPATAYIRSSSSQEVNVTENKGIGVSIMYTSETLQPGASLVKGRVFTKAEVQSARQVIVVNSAFVKTAHPAIDSTRILGHTFRVNGADVTVIGVVTERTTVPQCFLPITIPGNDELQKHPTTIFFEAGLVTDVSALKDEINNWLKNTYASHHQEFSVDTNEFRVAQAAKGFFLFRIIMGLIVGISVIVGGIGVMNVLLISVTERTTEIGIRKAMGATRRDIVVQFLSESVTISAFGCFLGLVLGVTATMVIIPIVKALTQIPFQAEYTINTLLIISIVALAIGVVFGTYPALRASRLDPVEAIRRNE